MINNIIRLFFTISLLAIAPIYLAQTSPLLHTKSLAEMPTVDEGKSVWFKMDRNGFEELSKTSTPLLSWNVQLPGEGTVELTLLESCPFPKFIPVGERRDDGAGGVKVDERHFTTDLIKVVSYFYRQRVANCGIAM